MLSRVILRNKLKATSLCALAFTLPVAVALTFLIPARACAQNTAVIIGHVEGDDFVIKSATPAGAAIDADPTAVTSGSEVTLRSGHAVLMLETGGEIAICGPAHFTLLESAGAVTLALDYGRIHPSLDPREIVTIYTPMMVATLVAISAARRNATIGLEPSGEMCVLAAQGAIRLEPQFSGQSLMVPQGGVINMLSGQLLPAPGNAASCGCDLPANANSLYSRELSVPAHPPQPTPQPVQPENKSNPDVPAAASPEPVYTVLMPPLGFDAKSPAPPPDPSPEMIILVREVRVRPSFVYHGRVNPAPVAALPRASVPVPSPPAQSPPAGSQPGIVTRMRNFFRKLNGQAPCPDAGCGK